MDTSPMSFDSLDRGSFMNPFAKNTSILKTKNTTETNK